MNQKDMNYLQKHEQMMRTKLSVATEWIGILSLIAICQLVVIAGLCVVLVYK